MKASSWMSHPAKRKCDSASMKPYPMCVEATTDPSERQYLLSLVIPTLNEEATIQRLLNRLFAVLDGVIPNQYELWVVDDCSEDKTGEQVRQLQAHYPQLHLLQRQRDRGLATAAIAGWQQARGDILGVIDGDLQHPPEVLPQLLQVINGEADLVIASRYVDRGNVGQWTGWRRIASKGAAWLGRRILPEIVGQVSDPMSGFFLIRREVISSCPLQPMGYKVLLEVLAKGRIGSVVEVGYRFDPRCGGRSKVTWHHSITYLLHLIRLRVALHSRRSRIRSLPSAGKIPCPTRTDRV